MQSNSDKPLLLLQSTTTVRPFVNTLYWNFNGLDQASHYSTSMVSKKAYRYGIFGSLVMVSCAYLLPILIATGATNLEQDEWKEGTFAVAATEIAAPWLGNWIVVSAGISLLAQFFSEMSADSMQLQGMAERGHLPSLFGHRSRHDTPSVRHFLTVLVCLFLDNLDVPCSTSHIHICLLHSFSVFTASRACGDIITHTVSVRLHHRTLKLCILHDTNG